jgi:hypothetical protein
LITDFKEAAATALVRDCAGSAAFRVAVGALVALETCCGAFFAATACLAGTPSVESMLLAGSVVADNDIVVRELAEAVSFPIVDFATGADEPA